METCKYGSGAGKRKPTAVKRKRRCLPSLQITKEKLNQDMENLAARLNGVEEFAGCTI